MCMDGLWEHGPVWEPQTQRDKKWLEINWFQLFLVCYIFKSVFVSFFTVWLSSLNFFLIIFHFLVMILFFFWWFCVLWVISCLKFNSLFVFVFFMFTFISVLLLIFFSFGFFYLKIFLQSFEVTLYFVCFCLC